MAVKPLQILVLLRETLDPRPPAEVTDEGAVIRDRGLRRVVNPADLEALEAALALGEDPTTPVTVTAVAVGPETSEEGLRQALAMGAARAVRVWAHGLDEADAAAGARLLSRVLEVLRPSLFFTGSRLLDRGDDPVPALAAARLGIACAPEAISAARNGGEVEVLRKCDRGARQSLALPLPGAVLFEPGFRVPRYPELDAVISALGAEIEVWGLPELDLPPWEVGEEGARLRTAGVSFPRPPPLRAPTPDPSLPGHQRVSALLSGGIKARAGLMHFGSSDEAAEGLFQILCREGLIPGAGG
jgi:electron transfer flavoprotein beta subunit